MSAFHTLVAAALRCAGLADASIGTDNSRNTQNQSTIGGGDDSGVAILLLANNV